jgi:5-methylcytosine-specific restriction protein B
MNESIAKREAQWDAFLQRWPLEELASMTLSQYSQAGDQDCFVYWLEAKTENLGSIWGGSAFKFGVYSRRDKSEKPNAIDRQYNSDYAWYAKYGDSPEQSFERVRECIIQIAKAARAGQLELVENADMGQVVKWKLAFLYQDRANPSVLPIYSLQNLQSVAGEGVPKRASDLYRSLLSQHENEPLFTYADQLWALSCKRLEESGAVQAVLKRFEVDPRFEKSLRNPEDRLLFYRLAVAVHERGLDWWVTKMINNGSIRFGRNNSLEGSTTATLMLLNPLQSGMQIRFTKRVVIDDIWRPLNDADIAMIEDPQFAADFLQENPIDREARWPDVYRVEDSDLLEDEWAPDVVKTNVQPKIAPPLNQILYGPPGTGKTHATIDEALRILDPEFLEKHENDRTALKARFDNLAAAEDVRFVTFHQSFSYEDFVEGLRAVTNDEKQLEYLVEPGVFKRLCDDARTHGVQPDTGIRSNPRIWKISINGSGSSPTKSYCLDHGEARIGWGHTGDLRQPFTPNNYYQSIGSGNQGTLQYFSEEIVPGDILLCLHSAETIAAVGVVTGDYRYDDAVPKEVLSDYNHVRPVNWLYRDLKLPILPLNDGKQFTLKTVYSMDRFTWGDLLGHIEKSGAKPAVPVVGASKRKPHVLIIDEINRGNISRIFGELITLIEPSKRAGAIEELSVTLPYSKKPFSVPSNVYLIGTMNTADRSLAGLDIALRRRFTFKEMPPRPELLDGIHIHGVNIGKLLRTMNERIDVLLDRDHCLGHAYFMPLKDNGTLDNLAFIFRQQILPLLQEYFFEDWERIRMVLNDHRKSADYQFIEKQEVNIGRLFGSTENIGNQQKVFSVNKDAFNHIQSYLGILDHQKALTTDNVVAIA